MTTKLPFLHSEIKNLRTQLEAQQASIDSISARINIVCSISGAMLTIFLGALANKVVNGMFARVDTNGRTKTAH